MVSTSSYIGSDNCPCQFTINAMGDVMVKPDSRGLWYSGKMIKKNTLRNKMIDAATILFDDNKNDLRALPKTVRLQILTVLSFVWSTVFSLYTFQITTFVWGWTGMVAVHILLIFACYYTFKQFHNKEYDKKPDPNDPPIYDDVWYGS